MNSKFVIAVIFSMLCYTSFLCEEANQNGFCLLLYKLEIKQLTEVMETAYDSEHDNRTEVEHKYYKSRQGETPHGAALPP